MKNTIILQVSGEHNVSVLSRSIPLRGHRREVDIETIVRQMEKASRWNNAARHRSPRSHWNEWLVNWNCWPVICALIHKSSQLKCVPIYNNNIAVPIFCNQRTMLAPERNVCCVCYRNSWNICFPNANEWRMSGLHVHLCAYYFTIVL